MFDRVINMLPKSMRQRARRELYCELESVTVMSRKEILNTIRKENIKEKIEHLFSIGYTKKQVVTAVSNEFNISPSRSYRYIKDAGYGKDRRAS